MKFRLITAMLLCGIIFAHAQENLTMLVGTYTGGGSKGIYSYQFNQMTGEAKALDSLSITNPSYLTISQDGRMVYAVSETNDERASVNAIRLKNGKMRLLKSAPTEGGDPCYVATNGRLVLTANYSGGSMSVFQLYEKGTQPELVTRFLGATGGPDLSRQETPHVHCACFTPDGKHILATDFSADRILSYKVQDKRVIANGIAGDVSADSGPRHITFSQNGKFAYVISELSGKITVFSYSDGKLQKLQEIVADSLNARGSADIHLCPDGKFLYASNRLKSDGIAIFAVDSQTGQLTPAGYQPTGIHPRQFNITPNGKYLLCACRDSNVIQLFSRDEKTGLLSDTHKDLKLSMPVCIQFYK